MPKLPPSRRDSFGKPSNRPSRLSRGQSAAADLLDLSSLDISDQKVPVPQSAPSKIASQPQQLFDFAAAPASKPPAITTTAGTGSTSSFQAQASFNSLSGSLTQSSSAADPFGAWQCNQSLPTSACLSWGSCRVRAAMSVCLYLLFSHPRAPAPPVAREPHSQAGVTVHLREPDRLLLYGSVNQHARQLHGHRPVRLRCRPSRAAAAAAAIRYAVLLFRLWSQSSHLRQLPTVHVVLSSPSAAATAGAANLHGLPAPPCSAAN